MPLIRSLASKRRLRLISLILSLGEIIPSYSYCVEKRLFYITISAPFSYQPSFYTKCTKLNIYLSCDVRLVSNIKYTCFIHSYILQNLQLFYLICLKVLYNNIYRET